MLFFSKEIRHYQLQIFSGGEGLVEPTSSYEFPNKGFPRLFFSDISACKSQAVSCMKRRSLFKLSKGASRAREKSMLFSLSNLNRGGCRCRTVNLYRI